MTDDANDRALVRGMTTSARSAREQADLRRMLRGELTAMRDRNGMVCVDSAHLDGVVERLLVVTRVWDASRAVKPSEVGT